MTIMTIRIPDDVKEAFDKAYEGEDKDAIIADLISKALHMRTGTEQAAADAPKRDLVAEFRNLRESMPSMTNEEIRQAREELRREAG